MVKCKYSVFVIEYDKENRVVGFFRKRPSYVFFFHWQNVYVPVNANYPRQPDEGKRGKLFSNIISHFNAELMAATI